MLPEGFLQLLCASLGEDAARTFLSAVDGDPSVSVRRNPLKLSKSSFAENFTGNCNGVVPWNDRGLYLASRPQFTLDPLLHAGAYYVQDGASMFVSKVYASLGIEKGRVLDLCAAPGGKSTDLLSVLSSDSLLVANEVISSRATILAENVVKWGSPNVAVTCDDPSHFKDLRGWFDVVLADVPCSGEGMFRKDADARREWSLENVEVCASRQRRIISDVWPAIKEGGYLIYSTCTFNNLENDGNVRWICEELGAEVLPLPEAPLSLSTASGGRQFVPGITGGEGFFCALLRKSAPERGERVAVKRLPKREKCSFVEEGNFVYRKNDLLKACPEPLLADILAVEERLHCIRSGVAVAVEKGRDLVPEHALALSSVMAGDAFRREELTLEQALSYLRRDPVHIAGERGYVLMTFAGVPIGFSKNIGSRSNNLYPASWRILKG